MQLDSLRIQNFRMLEDFSVKKLGRLNLIVGKSNSGKSTVLEALRVYAGSAKPEVMRQIAQERDEYSKKNLPLASFFTGRKLLFETGKFEPQYITIGELNNEEKLIKFGFDSTNPYHFMIKKGDINHNIDINQCIREYYTEGNRLLDFGSIFADLPTINCNYVPTQLIPHKDLISLWKTIDGTAREAQFIDALKMIEPRIVGVTDVEGVFEVRLEGEEERVPLKSLGEGMSRIFQLALHAFNAKGGFLLIDEFENGLHYSVQEQIWSWLFDLCASEQRDIQLFATTHSWDCVKNFSTVAEKKQDIEATMFRMGRSANLNDNGKIIAAEFNKESLHTLIEAELELR